MTILSKTFRGNAYAFEQTEVFDSSGDGNEVLANLIMKYYSLQVVGVGIAPNSWNVDLQVSSNGIDWSTIMTHATGLGNGEIYWSGNQMFPSRKMRAKVNSVDLGTATGLKVTIIGVP